MFLEKFTEYFPIIEIFTYILFDKRLKERIKNFETIIFLHYIREWVLSIV